MNSAVYLPVLFHELPGTQYYGYDFLFFFFFFEGENEDLGFSRYQLDLVSFFVHFAQTDFEASVVYQVISLVDEFTHDCNTSSVNGNNSS